jgi:hypothetical protein
MAEKRTKKISGDITPTAKALIDAYCSEKDLSKGKLLERMIVKFLGDETTTEKGGMSKGKRSAPKKAASYPSNLDEQFEMLWDIKGKKGAKNGTKGAYAIFKKLAANVDNETCETFTKMLIDDILSNSGECGYPEMHLTSYLNQQRWVK